MTMGCKLRLPIAAQLNSELGLRWTDIELVWQRPTDEIQRLVEQHDLLERLPSHPPPRKPLRKLFGKDETDENWCDTDGELNASFLEGKLQVMGWLDAEVHHRWQTNKQGFTLILKYQLVGDGTSATLSWTWRPQGWMISRFDLNSVQSRGSRLNEIGC